MTRVSGVVQTASGAAGAGRQPNDDLAFTLAHLARLDLLIRAEVLRARLNQTPRDGDELRGLYISDEQVDALLDRSVAAPSLLVPPSPAGEPLGALEAAIAAVDAQLHEREARTGRTAAVPRLERLRALFGLSDFERDVVLIALAAEIDLKYERLFAYLQDDVTKKRPTVDLVSRLLCPTLEDRLAARQAFDSGAPLLRWNLITLHDDPSARRPVLLARYLKLDERVADFLLGADALDARLRSLAADPPKTGAGAMSAGLAEWLQRVAGLRGRESGDVMEGGGAEEAERAPVYLFHGRYGTGRRAAAGALAKALGRPLLLLSARGLAEREDGVAQGLLLAEREALLTGALLGWADADVFLHLQPGGEAPGRAFVEALARGRGPAVLLAEKSWEPARSLERRPFLRLGLPDSTYVERRTLWAAGLAQLNGAAPGLGEEALSALAGRFRLTPGQIQDALAHAQSLAWARGSPDGHLSADDLDAACRTQAQHHLSALARQLTPRYGWEDIVLPAPQLTTLRLISTMIRQRPVVYGDWGFDRKLAMGKGVMALFAGPSGTGKTMAAEILARDLGLDLYKIDLSAVVNKYIGETEKNLERMFGEAQDSDAILFFDEADALFGKRSGVSDAHDRYANIETAYLLQRTEEYNGLVILASNLPKNMDDAFVRRLHFTINFPAPEEPERLEIWRRTFPPEAPRAADLDLPFLARKLKVTGGNIRNIILAAAFLAAEERAPIAMRHLVLAARYEFQKMGKMVLESDFERYFGLLRSS